jgi:hypothetical protein
MRFLPGDSANAWSSRNPNSQASATSAGGCSASGTSTRPSIGCGAPASRASDRQLDRARPRLQLPRTRRRPARAAVRDRDLCGSARAALPLRQLAAGVPAARYRRPADRSDRDDRRSAVRCHLVPRQSRLHVHRLHASGRGRGTGVLDVDQQREVRRSRPDHRSVPAFPAPCTTCPAGSTLETSCCARQTSSRAPRWASSPGEGRHGMGEQDHLYTREPGGNRVEVNTGGYRLDRPDWRRSSGPCRRVPMSSTATFPRLIR